MEKDEANEKYRFLVEFRCLDLEEGETVEVHIRQDDFEAKGTALPISALGRDEIGYFIYEVHRERDAWGYIYFLKRVGVIVLVGDEHSFSVYEYKYNYPLVKEITPELSDGSRVRISNEKTEGNKKSDSEKRTH